VIPAHWVAPSALDYTMIIGLLRRGCSKLDITGVFGAKEGGEEDGKYNPSSPRFTHYRVENNAIHP
jgi:hypothetical protein